MKTLDVRLDLIPLNPGVYLMKNAAGSIIYVGKAKHLRKRLRSYFMPNPVGEPKVLAMISHIADFEYIVCKNELEALILESNLIKKYQPHYNILMRDDKEYPYIRVTMNEAYPRVLKAYHIGEDIKDGARYFGPYLNYDLQKALKILQQIFLLKTCRRVFPRDIGKKRPCLNYYIHHCIGPCTGKLKANEYHILAENVCSFLEGKYQKIFTEIKTDMETAAAKQDFEAAAVLRDRLFALEKIMEQQIISGDLKLEQDVFGLSRNGNECCIEKLMIREGRLISASSYFIMDKGESEAELLAAFIQQHYYEKNQIPKQIIVPVIPEAEAVLLAYLKSKKVRGAIHFLLPQRGHNYKLLKMANDNALVNLKRHTLNGGNSQIMLEQTLKLLAKLLQSKLPLNMIEAYDISNTGKQDQVGSMVVFENGKPKRKAYRRFKIKNAVEQNDYEAMKEVVTRRLEHLEEKEFGLRPDLFLIDGGKQHVQLVKKILQDKKIKIQVAGMVKDDKHRSRGLVLENGKIIELRKMLEADDEATRKKQPDILAVLRLLTAIQNEAHRYAGAYNQVLRKKRNLHYSLEDIPGIGPQKRKMFLQHFKSLKKIESATLEELKQVEKIHLKDAEAVYHYFQQ